MLSGNDHWQNIVTFVEKALKEKARETQAMEAMWAKTAKDLNMEVLFRIYLKNFIYSLSFTELISRMCNSLKYIISPFSNVKHLIA